LKLKQRKRNEPEEEVEEVNLSKSNMESDQSMQRGDDELGKEYLAFIEHRNKVLEEKLAGKTALLLKKKESQDAELQLLNDKIKQLIQQRDELLKRKS